MTTIRDNAVILKSTDIVDVAVVPGSIVVTKGQPFSETISVDVTDGVVSILIKSGRKKSRAVAEHFAKAVGGMGKAFAPQGGSGGLPKELNFCFGLILTFADGSTSEVVLAQGSNFPRNNWWIGSKDLENQRLDVGKGYLVDGVDIQDDIGDTFEKVVDNIPVKYQSAVRLFGLPLFKQLFGAVNVFTFK